MYRGIELLMYRGIELRDEQNKFIFAKSIEFNSGTGQIRSYS